ncbi:serine hydrolase domain-containing protein [Isobaculum melis]|uniref:CubicO group peptidase, beta-lactamase class C family n=1 Tax=Isobaculum melis TaxID=142588 RepID=A0A1H9SZJ4_9LACT|nr:serine hydrolase domain-containing protein [Isobaculum melis]SER90247.1 CubicO group peptidase, beta-lactamase class C family [Isobaculum melis]
MQEQITAIIPKEFSGVISITKNHQSIYQKAFNYADKPNKRLNQLDTKFGMASGSKTFIALGILTLIEEGKLALTDTIGALMNIDWKQIDAEITVEQLLTHTSGIPDYFDEDVMTDYAELWENLPNYRMRKSTDLIPLFIDKKMDFPKGTKFKYSNTGYVVLGLIIEAVTKEKFDTYLAKELFPTIGMNQTGYYELDRLPGNCAAGYLFDEPTQQFYSNIYSIDAKGSGAGGGFTTADDIHSLWKQLLTNQVLSEAMTREVLSPQTEDTYSYGFWFMKNEEGRAIPYMLGFDPGVRFISSYNLDKDINITILCNVEFDEVVALHREIKGLMDRL